MSNNVVVDGVKIPVSLPRMRDMQKWFDVMDSLSADDTDIEPLLQLSIEQNPTFASLPSQHLITACMQYLNFVGDDVANNKRLQTFYEVQLQENKEIMDNSTPHSTEWNEARQLYLRAQEELGQAPKKGYEKRVEVLLAKQGVTSDLDDWMLNLAKESGFTYKELSDLTWAEFIRINNKVAKVREVEFARERQRQLEEKRRRASQG